MTKQLHTQEPWNVREVQGQIYIGADTYEGHPYHKRTTHMEVMSDEDYPTKEADANRIVACVNACKGITNEALESPMFRDAIRTKGSYLEVIKQHGELLAAVKFIVGDIIWNEDSPSLKMLNKLIKKVEKS